LDTDSIAATRTQVNAFSVWAEVFAVANGGRLRKLITELRPHAIWELLRWIGPLVGAAMISALAVLVQKIRHVSFDWFLFGGMFSLSFLIFVGFLYIARRLGAVSKQEPEHKSTPPALPDTSVKDADPKVYVEFHDDRGSVSAGMAETSLDLVNRGGRNARWPCVEDIYLKEYVIRFSTTTGNVIVPGNGVVVEPGIQDNSKQPGYVQNMIQAFMREWFTYDDPNKYELSIPLSLTYQDADKNLFETRCELVLYPGQEAKVKTHGVLPGIKVVDTRNHQFRKVAIATVKSSLL
jgi:hypothetical protein